MTVKPLSPLYIWVHIIENEIWFYRKKGLSKMVAKLSTTINKIEKLPNSSNSKIINDFLIYMKDNGSSERHQNNNLNVMIEIALFLGPNTTFMISIRKNKYCHF